MPKINREEYEILKGLDGNWEWVARDINGYINFFEEKPMKHSYPRYWMPVGKDYKRIHTLMHGLSPITNLFQFIQWEDEEPHNIAELIEEYEQSLVESIYEDEKEVLSQELPVIPKFVAEWYESEGKQSSWWNWFYKWGRDESRSDLETKTIRWMQDYNEEKFVDMFLHGYTVEEEQKYRLKLNGDYLSSVQVDYGAEKGKPIEVVILADVKGLPYGFSEDEKSYVEKYLNVEVEELEE